MPHFKTSHKLWEESEDGTSRQGARHPVGQLKAPVGTGGLRSPSDTAHPERPQDPLTRDAQVQGAVVRGRLSLTHCFHAPTRAAVTSPTPKCRAGWDPDD